jgi:hypothetical protein
LPNIGPWLLKPSGLPKGAAASGAMGNVPRWLFVVGRRVISNKVLNFANDFPTELPDLIIGYESM